jgi:hypothetical protein
MAASAPRRKSPRHCAEHFSSQRQARHPLAARGAAYGSTSVPPVTAAEIQDMNERTPIETKLTEGAKL